MTTENKVKDYPIIFSTDMVKAILGGSKTQTRRVVKPQPRYTIESVSKNWQDYPESFGKEYIADRGYYSGGNPNRLLNTFFKCPYGQVGDRLWVRETFWIEHDHDYNEFTSSGIDCGYNLKEDDWAHIWYVADGQNPADDDFIAAPFYSKHPSIHMPRWASRISLEITEVRVERLQEITERDALSEGILWEGYGWKTVNTFANLWDSLNAQRGYGWDSNCWVWVISFNLEKDSG